MAQQSSVYVYHSVCETNGSFIFADLTEGRIFLNVCCQAFGEERVKLRLYCEPSASSFWNRRNAACLTAATPCRLQLCTVLSSWASTLCGHYNI